MDLKEMEERTERSLDLAADTVLFFCRRGILPDNPELLTALVAVLYLAATRSQGYERIAEAVKMSAGVEKELADYIFNKRPEIQAELLLIESRNGELVH